MPAPPSGRRIAARRSRAGCQTLVRSSAPTPAAGACPGAAWPAAACKCPTRPQLPGVRGAPGLMAALSVSHACASITVDAPASPFSLFKISSKDIGVRRAEPGVPAHMCACRALRGASATDTLRAWSAERGWTETVEDVKEGARDFAAGTAAAGPQAQMSHARTHARTHAHAHARARAHTHARTPHDSAVDAPASPFSAVGVKSRDFSCKKLGGHCDAVAEVVTFPRLASPLAPLARACMLPALRVRSLRRLERARAGVSVTYLQPRWGATTGRQVALGGAGLCNRRRCPRSYPVYSPRCGALHIMQARECALDPRRGRSRPRAGEQSRSQCVCVCVCTLRPSTSVDAMSADAVFAHSRCCVPQILSPADAVVAL